MDAIRLFIAGFVAFVTLIAIVSLGVKTGLLLDQSNLKPPEIPPYSFSRVQLAWWTTIIALCLLVKYGFTGSIDTLSPSCLILLGISIATTGTAKVVDDRDVRAATVVGATAVADLSQNQKTDGFFKDILSDNQGINVHRLQALIFNFLFGFVFIYEFGTNLYGEQLPDFSTQNLGLLGLSSATYIGLKAGENK